MPYTWTDTHGLITLDLEPADIHFGAQSGDCEPYIAALRSVPYIRKQLDALDPEEVRDYLKGFGAWDAGELADDDFNLTRLLWLACGEAQDEIFMAEEG